MRSSQSFTRSFFGTVFGVGLIAGLVVMAGVKSQAQTSVALGVYGAFNGTTTGDGTQESPANQAGGLFEFRQIKNPLVGYEATYSYNRGDQSFSYSNLSTPPCPTSGCSVTTAAIADNAHEVTADWVVSLHAATLRPFALAGGGLLLNVPSGGTVTMTTCGTANPLCSQSTTAASTRTSTEGVFSYGAGLDWELLPHLGLRFQYRGNVYKAPAIANAFSSTNAFTHNAEPVIGIYFRL
jgi:Outer membrane protein beta-barrel domain